MKRAAVAVLLCLAPLLVAAKGGRPGQGKRPNAPAERFVGIACTDDTYENEPATGNKIKEGPLHIMQDCSDFVYTMQSDSRGKVEFFRTLKGISEAVSDGDYDDVSAIRQRGRDEQVAETVDLLVLAGHGASWWPSPGDLKDGMPPAYLTSSYILTWDYSDWAAATHNMRLGDEGRGTSFLAMVGCNTVHFDQWLFERFHLVFRGGLRMYFGNWGNFNAGGDGLNEFGKLLFRGPASDAWINGLMTGPSSSPVAAASGSTREECLDRLDRISYRNFNEFRRIRDDEVKYVCWDAILYERDFPPDYNKPLTSPITPPDESKLPGVVESLETYPWMIRPAWRWRGVASAHTREAEKQPEVVPFKPFW